MGCFLANAEKVKLLEIKDKMMMMMMMRLTKVASCASRCSSSTSCILPISTRTASTIPAAMLYPQSSRRAATTVVYMSTAGFCSFNGNGQLFKYRKAKDIDIPIDKVNFSFARSSGPGGQNVNKLNTKAELRFNVEEAADVWIPKVVAKRLQELQSNKINSAGELLITSQEHRTQKDNKSDCLTKLQSMLEEAYIEPKDRKTWTGISKRTKDDRKDFKRHRAAIKSTRGKGNYKDYD